MKIRISAFLLLILTFAFSSCQNREELSGEKTGAVALYSDRGVWPQSVTAAERMFQWMGYDVQRVNAQDVRNGILVKFQLLCVPGGNMYNYAEDLTSPGVENIKNFVHQGGGYMGICGGAYFAGEKVFWQGNQLPMMSLGLFPGETRGPYEEIAPYPDSTMSLVITSGTSHPITEEYPDSSWILYFWGPALLPDDTAEVAVLGQYAAIAQPAMLATVYGRGRVFLIGTHPEIEEDSDRDGVAECDELADRGSDWELMKKAASWCLGE
jgi:glutamine amidotransferase-like uncharacterized protein